MPSRGSYNKISLDVKKLIINLYNGGLKSKYIAENSKVNVKTVDSIIRAYKKDQQFVRPRGHRKKKLTDEQVEQLKE